MGDNISVGNMSGSNIVTGNVQGNVNSFSGDVSGMSTDVTQFIKAFKENIDQLNLSASVKSEALVEIQTIELQMTSPKPKHSIVNESLKSLRSILEGIVSSSLATGLLQMLSKLVF